MDQAPLTDPFSVPEGHCPKCVGARKPEARSCPSCGLVFIHGIEGLLQPAPAQREAWLALLPRWADPRAHRGYLLSAQLAGELATAGRLYRLHLARNPEDERAREAIAEILRLALLPCERSETAEEPVPRPRLQRIAAFALVLVFGSVGSALAVRTLMSFGAQ